MRKLIFRCNLALGDIVMLTAAVRDLHRCYPGRFQTDVRTSCPGLWEHNPHLTPLDEDDPNVKTIDCSYPLINHANTAPYHCLHGFISFLNDRLRLGIRPTLHKGDMHLSDQERAWYSQVHEFARAPIPFWIVAAGGKYDLTIKWWQTERYQEVIDYFRGRIQFVQVGQWGHHHPKLDGTIDLRGRTSLRELVRLVHHAQGVLCSITGLMHLAAAVPTRRGQPRNRPCVVVAGGREPVHWEAYPDHQFIHTNGALACCMNGGCWRDRTFPLRDGDRRDKPANRCVDVVNNLPRCMDMISAAEVTRRIELYFNGGVINYLNPGQQKAARRGVHATRRNAYDRQPLNLQSAGLACDRFISTIPPYPRRFKGRGIVICGGGIKYFTNAWVCINMLRRLGCQLPIELWYRGSREMSVQMKALLAPLKVECVDANRVRREFPARHLGGWELKPYAILHSRFEQILLLDADNVPVAKPDFLFESPEFQDSGAIFWPDLEAARSKKMIAIWRSCGMRPPDEREFESGQIVVDKSRCWAALCLSMWFNEQSDFYYQYVHGDKETFHLAFRKLKARYRLVPHPIHALESTMCQHDFQGRRLFQHRNCDKWDLFLRNKRVRGFWFEQECRQYLVELRKKWDGGMSLYRQRGPDMPKSPKPTANVKIETVVVGSAGLHELGQQTLRNLKQTDWDKNPLQLNFIEDHEPKQLKSQMDQARAQLQSMLQRGADYVLFLGGGLTFNRHLQHNLHRWAPVRDRSTDLACLYNPGTRDWACDLQNNARIADPMFIQGDAAFLLSREVVLKIVQRWETVKVPDDLKISRIAISLRNPVVYHAPSLVQRVKPCAKLLNPSRPACDFDPAWRA